MADLHRAKALAASHGIPIDEKDWDGILRIMQDYEKAVRNGRCPRGLPTRSRSGRPQMGAGDALG